MGNLLPVADLSTMSEIDQIDWLQSAIQTLDEELAEVRRNTKKVEEETMEKTKILAKMEAEIIVLERQSIFGGGKRVKK